MRDIHQVVIGCHLLLGNGPQALLVFGLIKVEASSINSRDWRLKHAY